MNKEQIGRDRRPASTEERRIEAQTPEETVMILAEHWRIADREDVAAIKAMGSAEMAHFKARDDHSLARRAAEEHVKAATLGDRAAAALLAVYSTPPRSIEDAIAVLEVIAEAEETVFEEPALAGAISNVIALLRARSVS